MVLFLLIIRNYSEVTRVEEHMDWNMDLNGDSDYIFKVKVKFKIEDCQPRDNLVGWCYGLNVSLQNSHVEALSPQGDGVQRWSL